MTLRDRLVAITAAMPDGASVTLPVSELREWLDEDSVDGPAGSTVDLTCDDVAGMFGRTAACVRGWCRMGRLPGAYRLRGTREWRIPRAAVRAFQEAEAAAYHQRPPRPGDGGPVDLGAWRQG